MFTLKTYQHINIKNICLHIYGQTYQPFESCAFRLFLPFEMPLLYVIPDEEPLRRRVEGLARGAPRASRWLQPNSDGLQIHLL